MLDCAESDRVGVLEALWAYKKSKGLIVEIGAGGAEAPAAAAGGGGGATTSTTATNTGALKSGIKTDERTAKVSYSRRPSGPTPTRASKR